MIVRQCQALLFQCLVIEGMERPGFLSLDVLVYLGSYAIDLCLPIKIQKEYILCEKE